MEDEMKDINEKMENKEKISRMNKHVKVILVQVIFLTVVFTIIYFMYPKINVDIDGETVSFNSINTNMIIISENPDFSNSRYLDIEERENVSFNLKPGTYYWRVANNYIEGLKNEFTIESEVGMKIDRKTENDVGENEEDESELVNIGNVKLNVTKGQEGVLIGYIILEPNESAEIEDKDEKYTGRQE